MGTMVCDRCEKTYPDLFDSIVRIDYAEPGKGKPYEFHICVACRKTVIGYIEQSEDERLIPHHS